MKCSNCQSDNPAGANFCGGCGSPLNIQLCPACDYENPPAFKFCGKCGVSLETEEPNHPSTESLGSQRERRHLTVLFCDLVDSTRLSHLMDPEDLLAIFETYQDVCTRQINYYGGTVARFIGDGIWAYFGYPRAH